MGPVATSRINHHRRKSMRSSPRNLVAFAATGLLAVGVAACGGSSSNTTTGGGQGASSGAPAIPLKAGENPVGQTLTGSTKKRGGTLTVYSSEDFEHLDPGESYFTQDYGVDYVSQRPLFSYKPNTTETLSP